MHVLIVFIFYTDNCISTKSSRKQKLDQITIVHSAYTTKWLKGLDSEQLQIITY